MLSVQGATSGQQVPGVLCHISTHAPRAGSDSFVLLSRSRNFTFQSTLPVRGATGHALGHLVPQSLISIHAPRAGSDQVAKINGDVNKISIHAPRAGSDFDISRGIMHSNNFNPRSPCGERRPMRSTRSTPSYFNPRSPCGERLDPSEAGFSALDISIHAPRAGSDSEDAQNGTVYFEQLS